MTDDFYDLLDVSSDASQDEIKDAYREKVRIYHPDLNDDDRARAQFTALKKAHDVLGDPVERQAYDRLGHETYVAKRTSGIPSPDVWADDEDEGSTDAATAAEPSAGDDATRVSDDDESERDDDATGAGGDATRAADATATASTGTDGGGYASASRDAGSHATAGATASRTGRGRGETRAGTGSGDARSSRLANSRVVRWWNRQNFAWPLIWWALFTYVGGLAHFAIENGSDLRLLWSALEGAGADVGEVQRVLAAGQYGVDSPLAFVSSVELVAPPLEGTQWYATLAGIVIATFVALLVVRVTRRANAWGKVTIDETIAVALAATVTGSLVGGPLLAGAVLMPLLFGVIVYRTRQLGGWSPSYLYVIAVLAPLCGLAFGIAGARSLPLEFLLFVVLPLAGGFGLPLRTAIRSRFGR